MVKKPNPSDVSEEAKDIAKKLGANLDESEKGKGEKEPDSPKKTGTEATEEEGRSGESEKSSAEQTEQIDYKEKYSASTKEVQEKYIPMEKQIKELADITGKDLEVLITEAKTAKTETEKAEKDTSGDGAEVGAKSPSIEDELKEVQEKVSELTQQASLAAKEKVKIFLDANELSEDYYEKEIKPKLPAVQQLTKENGDPFTLEEGLEVAYLIANKDKIPEIVAKRAEQQKKLDESGSFSPEGAKDSSSIEKPEFSEEQIEMAKKFKVDLTKEEEK